MEKTDVQRVEQMMRIMKEPENRAAMQEAVDFVMDMFDPDSPVIGILISVGPVGNGNDGRGEAKMLPIAMEYSEMVSILMQTANTLYKNATADAPARSQFN